jgi:hypothetical protein
MCEGWCCCSSAEKFQTWLGTRRVPSCGLELPSPPDITLHSSSTRRSLPIPSPTAILPSTHRKHVTEIRFSSKTAIPLPPCMTPPLTVAQDHHLLARGTSLPGRICARGYFARRDRTGQGHQQTAGAGHISREALHPERVRQSCFPQCFNFDTDECVSAT